MPYLATTAISEIWEIEDNKVFLLGPWCINSYSNLLLKKVDYTIVPSPWDKREKLIEAMDYCYATYNDLLPQLTDRLNFIHKHDHPLKYWRILLGPWLLYFISVFYERYTRLENALQLYPDLHTSVFSDDKCNLACFDTYNFIDCKQDEDYFNLKLFSIIAKELMPHGIIKKEVLHQDKIQTIRYGFKRKSLFWLLKQMDFFFDGKIALSEMYHLNPFDMVMLKIKTNPQAIHFIDFDSMKLRGLRVNKSADERKKLQLNVAVGNFKSLLYKIVPDSILLCYLENYEFYRANISVNNNTNIIGSAISWNSNERFKFLAAEASLRGSKTIDFQHGGGSGYEFSFLQERLSLEKDIFYTWGWNSTNTTKPLPSPHLSRLLDTYSPKVNKVLFIGTIMRRYQYFFFNPINPEDADKYFNDKIIFFELLREDIKNKIVYRPYPNRYGWQEPQLIKNLTYLRFISRGKLTNWMQKAKLVIIDHYSTSPLEALVINVPCILYWDHDVFLVRKEAERYFELLREAGILYKNPKAAAQKANEIFDNPQKWWLSDKVQNARLKFCQRFAYARKDWLNIWADELKRLQQEPLNSISR